ncbi:hypothetical protein JKP76_01910 [Blastococcus sp. TML/C7B]|uniref:hypothetical protein n=1 Tax=Blastococcus sp. TML/C7B TaxID=2798728 RepID=UPI00190E11BB|nr:hypothetical protein [Blastococcus sp. TML/C7B]MBN1094920.1 hypothetical protein [Blastococcus sp. TML/C7B]
MLDAIGSRGHRSVDVITSRFLHDRRMDEEFRHLTRDGLVRRAIPARLVGKTHAHTTAAGRRALRQFAERPESDGGSAVQVALHGRDAMSDDRLRAEIFDRAPVVLPPRSERRNPRSVHPSQPHRLSSVMTGELYMDGDPAAAGGLAVDRGAGPSGRRRGFQRRRRRPGLTHGMVRRAHDDCG